VRTRDHAATRCNVDSMHGTVLVLVLVLTLMLTCSHTLKPSLRRHALCASIMSAHASSPFRVTHSSRGARVSGHAQQMRQVGFFSSWGSPASTGELEDMSWHKARGKEAPKVSRQVKSS
jgi:hypothetical protein